MIYDLLFKAAAETTLIAAAAATRIAERPVSKSGAALILAVWAGFAALLVWQFWPR